MREPHGIRAKLDNSRIQSGDEPIRQLRSNDLLEYRERGVRKRGGGQQRLVRRHGEQANPIVNDLFQRPRKRKLRTLLFLTRANQTIGQAKSGLPPDVS